MLFHSFFKSLEKKGNVTVIVELKNGVAVKGVLSSVDEHLNLCLQDVQADPVKYPQMAAVKSCFIRGSTVRYIQLPPSDVDVPLLMDMTSKELDKAA